MTIGVEKVNTNKMSFREKAGIYSETTLRAQHGLLDWGIDVGSFLSITNDINGIAARLWTLFPLAVMFNTEDNAKANFFTVIEQVKKDFNFIIESLMKLAEKETKIND
jgi:hypothetical protein